MPINSANNAGQNFGVGATSSNEGKKRVEQKKPTEKYETLRENDLKIVWPPQVALDAGVNPLR